jgi:hypothetical protein
LEPVFWSERETEREREREEEGKRRRRRDGRKVKEKHSNSDILNSSGRIRLLNKYKSHQFPSSFSYFFL